MAFVTVSGVRALRSGLDEFALRGAGGEGQGARLRC